MNPSNLQALGLSVRGSGDAWEADLDLGAALINPVSQLLITRVTFAPVGERLMVLSPPALVGLPPVALANIVSGEELENQLAAAFDEFVFVLQRRSDELQALGISATLNPDSLLLSADVQADVFLFTLASDKRGQFHVAQVQHEGKLVRSEFGQPFDISEFRERQALAGYLLALVNAAGTEPTAAEAAPRMEPLLFSEVVDRFGEGARLPVRSGLEVLVMLRVGDVNYRFAAARVIGRTFRGLLAGPQGKLWAERFEVQDFPGAKALLANALGLPLEQVQVLGSEFGAS